MKVVLLDGSLDGNGGLKRIRSILSRQLVAVKCELDAFELRKMEIAPCQGCFGCWERTPGECLIKDASQEIVRAIVRADLLVLLTPLTFGGYSSELKKVLDRGICLISPFFMTIQGETHHKPRYDRLPRLLGIGVAIGKDPEGEKIFTSLVQRNAINLHAPAHSAVVLAGSESEDEISSQIEDAITELEILQ